MSGLFELPSTAKRSRKQAARPDAPAKAAEPVGEPVARQAARYDEDAAAAALGVPKLIPTCTAEFKREYQSILFGHFREGVKYLARPAKFIPDCYAVMVDRNKPHVYAPSVMARDLIIKPLPATSR